MTSEGRSPQRAHGAVTRWYLVARGAACVSCIAHGWRAFRDPEEKDVMSSCTLMPIDRVQARNKREAVAAVVSRMAAGHGEEKDRGAFAD